MRTTTSSISPDFLARPDPLLPLPSYFLRDPTPEVAELIYRDRYQALTGSSLWECPACYGRMIVIAEIPPGIIPAITQT